MKKVLGLFPGLQPVWEQFVTKRIQHKRQAEMVEYLHGAIERFKQLTFAYDRIVDTLRHRVSGNDTWFLVNFHLWNFITLIRSLGDNLSWILNFHYEMNLNPENIDLL